MKLESPKSNKIEGEFRNVKYEESVELKNKYFEKEKLLHEIKEKANYQGNYSELFLERLNNLDFKDKLVNMLYDSKVSFDSIYKSYDFTEDKPRPLSRKENYFEHKKGINLINKDSILKELNERIDNVFSKTSIEFNSRDSVAKRGSSEIVVGFLNPECFYSEKQMSSLQKNIVEAHEQGHIIRDLSLTHKFSKKILSGFDFSNMKLPIYMINGLRDFYLKDNLSDGEIINIQKEYFENPNEIIERMAQLRNYFGMKYNEVFTKEHLDYVRENYSKDTGFYLQIQPFLQAITPQTEKKFLELINELPI